MPKISPEQIDARRAQILRAAMACFARKGPADTTMSDIFAAAGLSAGAVYTYFEGKHDLLRGVLALYAEENRAATQAVLAGGDPTASLGDLLLSGLALLDAAEEHPDVRLPVMLFAEAQHDADIAAAVRELYRATTEAFRSTAIALQASGRLDPDWDAEYLCWAAVAMFEGWRAMKLTDPHLSTQRFAAIYKRLFAPLFGSSAPSPRDRS